MDEPEHDVVINEDTPQAAVNDSPKAQVAAAKEEPYRSGEWDGIPNYKCPYCLYATIEGSHAVQVHIDEARLNLSHPTMVQQHTKE